MLTLQIILTHKSRLKYGNQKNSWKVSINRKTPVGVSVKPASESQAWEEMRWVFWSHCVVAAVRLQAGRGEWVTEDPSMEIGSFREPLSIWWIPLSPRMAVVTHTKPAIHQSRFFFRHPLSVDQREDFGDQACIIRTLSAIRTSHWTFNFSLGRSIYAGKVLTVHSFCSILEPADVWLGRPTLFDVVLFWECPAVKKVLSIQIKEKYFCIQLLAVTRLPFFRALAWCHPQARLQTYLFPSVTAVIPTVHNCLQYPYNTYTEKENTANPILLRTALEIFSCSNLSFISFLFFFFFVSALMFFTNCKIFDVSHPFKDCFYFF